MIIMVHANTQVLYSTVVSHVKALKRCVLWIINVMVKMDTTSSALNPGRSGEVKQIHHEPL